VRPDGVVPDPPVLHQYPGFQQAGEGLHGRQPEGRAREKGMGRMTVWIADVLIELGLIVMTLGVHGIVQFPDVYTQLDASSKATFPGVSILLVATALGGAADRADGGRLRRHPGPLEGGDPAVVPRHLPPPGPPWRTRPREGARRRRPAAHRQGWQTVQGRLRLPAAPVVLDPGQAVHAGADHLRDFAAKTSNPRTMHPASQARTAHDRSWGVHVSRAGGPLPPSRPAAPSYVRSTPRGRGRRPPRSQTRPPR
jgi:hypothetical protein